MPDDLGEPRRDAGPAPFRAALKAAPSDAARVREEFVLFCEALEVPSPAVDDLALALAEALDNVIEHGCGGSPGEELLVEAAVERGRVRLTVRDRGPQFDPTTAPGPAGRTLNERGFGGFGLRLVRSLVDEMAYERRDGENRLLLVKRVGEP